MRHRRTRIIPRAILGALICGLGFGPIAGSIAAAGDPSRHAQEDRTAWFDFKFHGSKVGFLEALDEAIQMEGRPALHSRRWSVISVRRQEQLIRMEATTDAWFDPSGVPMRYKHQRMEGGEARSSDGYRDGDVFVMRTDVGGNLSEKRIPLGKDLYLASSLDVVFDRSLRLGAQLQGRAIMEEEGEVRDFSIRVTGKEKTPDGEAFIVDGTVAGVASREWTLANGRTLRVSIPALGAEFVSTTREEALRLDTAVDIFSSALFATKAGLPPGGQIEELVVRLTGKAGRVPSHIVDDRQRVLLKTKSFVELAIRGGAAPKSSLRLPIRDASKKAFLVETPYEPMRDERLLRAAREIVGKDKDAWGAAKRINAFVHRHIENKSLARAFATAAEAYEKKEGDCTEHAVLFSALAKITGIPTRLVTGLVYVGGKDGVFGYHEWVEVWMGQEWVAMDPTFGQDMADATHLKFTQGLSDPDGLREAGIAAASMIGDLKLEVLSYTTESGEKRQISAER